MNKKNTNSQDVIDEQPPHQGGGAPRSLLILLAVGLLAGSVMALLTIINPSRSASLTSFAGPTSVPDRVSPGEPAPDFSGTTPSGQTIVLSDLRGRPVAVNFWATWCAPCVVEMPVLQEAYERYGGPDSGLMILGVNAGESAEEVVAFMEEHELTFPPVLDPDGEIIKRFEVRVFPTTVWVDSEGIVRAEHFGPLTPEAIDEYLGQILESPLSASAR